MNKLAGIIFSLMAIIGIVMFTSNVINALNPRDDTDSPTERSGMVPVTDYATGCQYLRTALGGLTPRMAEDGKTQRGCGTRAVPPASN